MGDIPQAVVTTSSDGEISCSIEETNRIRIALGLRPLDVGPAKPKEQVVDLQAQRDAEAERAALAARIERARNERIKAQQDKAASLGQALKQQSLSASDWVALSRKKEAVEVKQANSSATQRAGAGAGAGGKAGSELAGVRIHHDADAFEEGQEMVLTLADRGVLDDAGQGLADDEDELVNAALVDKERGTEYQDRKKKAKMPVYSGIDDDEFSGEVAAPGAGRPNKGLLYQYDEAEAEGKRKLGSLVIGADGSVTDEAAAERVRQRLASAAAEKSRIDLGTGVMESVQVASDFYTKAEVLAIAKPKKKKKVRKAGSELPENDSGAAAPASEADGGMRDSGDLIAQLQRQAGAGAGAGGEVGADRGSRARREQAAAKDIAADAAARVQREQAYAAALSKASEKTTAMLGAAPSGAGAGAGAGAAEGAPSTAGWAVKPEDDPATLIVKPAAATAGNLNAFTKQRVYSRLRSVGDEMRSGGAGGGAGEEDEEDDAELQAMLARARRAAAAKQPSTSAGAGVGAGGGARQSSAAASSGAVGGAAAESAQQEEEEEVEESPQDAAARAVAAALSRSRKHEMDASAGSGEGSGGSGSGGMVFTSTTEFSRLLQARVLESQQQEEAELHAASSASAAAAAAEAGSSSAAAASSAGHAAASAAGRKRARAEGDDATGVGDGSHSHSSKRRRGAEAGSGSGSGAAWVELDANGAPTHAGGEDVDMEADDDDGGAGYGYGEGEGEEGEGYGEGEGEGEDEAVEGSFTSAEAHAPMGLAGALRMFTQRGAVQNKESFAGRAKDKRPTWVGGSEDPAPDIKLEYKDEYGRQLTQKEAYRLLSYRFHGRDPSKNVRDKRLRKMQQEQRLASGGTGDTPLGTLAALQRIQEARGQAYVAFK